MRHLPTHKSFLRGRERFLAVDKTISEPEILTSYIEQARGNKVSPQRVLTKSIPFLTFFSW